MKLDTEFRKLPLKFDAERLAAEVSRFAPDEWRAHPQGHAGNTAIPLIAVNGDPANDGVKGPMRPTPLLARCPYIRQVLAALGTVLGRTRLMRIVGQGEATAHVDTNYYWMQRVRVHVPVVTFPEVQFVCGGRSLNMAAGECWIFDTWRLHNVLNPASRDRVHLVADTVGSAAFWELVECADGVESVRVPFALGREPELETESVNFPIVMSPWEQESLIVRILEDVIRAAPSPNDSDPLEALLERFHRQWRALWARFGESAPGWPAFGALLKELDGQLTAFAGRHALPNDLDAVEALRQAIVRPAINPELADSAVAASSRPPAVAVPETPPASVAPESRFERPVFIVAAPRSGSTLLFETLARSPEFWTIGGESHEVFESLSKLCPANRDYGSNRLTEDDAEPTTADAVRAGFRALLRDRTGGAVPPGTECVRLLEKTPKNALRIPFLRTVFPDAIFIYLFRRPEENLGSILDAWGSGRFVTYPELPGWAGPPWSLLLIPGWQELVGKPLVAVAAAQWESAHRHMLDDLSFLPTDRWCTVDYAELMADPQTVVARLCRFAGVSWDQELSGPLPLSRHTLTPPRPDKWRAHEKEIALELPALRRVEARVREALAADPTRTPAASTEHAPTAPATSPTTTASQPDGPDPLRSVHTTNLAGLLGELGISLLVTTYQAGKLIVVRNDGGTVNTHFRSFPMPMGLALTGNRLALGTKHHIWDFRNQPAVAEKLPPVGRHDACFMPRSCHFTGDIRVHELAFGTDGLWIVNTRFSCLCTVDPDNSFVPRWNPPFVTALAPEDRCHLNGLAMHNGQPTHVTCLGATDTASGWRENKRNGGLLLDVPSGEVVARGLSMPHSPRQYDGKLWVLESGRGSLAVIDPRTGKSETVATVPGFTRGLDFCGPYAFIGLSQVRETAVFSGIPITEGLRERTAGVWVVDVRTGGTVAFLRFESGVQEIFAVQVLAGTRFPDLITDDDDVIGNSFVLPDPR